MTTTPGMAGIAGIGVYFPGQNIPITDSFSEAAQMIGVGDAYISRLSGIKSKWHAPPGTLPSEIAAEASVRALSDSGISPDEIDLVIYYGVYGDYPEPATAKNVAKRLHNRGISKSAQAFDIDNACQGFMNALQIANSFIGSGTNKAILICGGELGSKAGVNATETIRRQLSTATRTDALPAEPHALLRLLAASFTLGDGATAAIVTEPSRARFEVEGFLTQDDSTGADLCTIESLELAPLVVDPPRLMDIAIPLALETMHRYIRRFREADSIESGYLVAHHPSKSAASEYKRGLSFIPRTIVQTFEHNGNLITGSVAAGFASIDSEVRPGDRIFTSTVGSGVSAAAASFMTRNGP